MITLDISKCRGFSHHRSGWSYAISQLRSIHSSSGILCDDFIERSFSWELSDYYTGKNHHELPYKKNWIGFLHNPPNVPDWFDYYNSPQAIINREVFLESLKTCKAIIVLSDYLKEWLISTSKIPVPIISVKHPTEIPQTKWCPDRFIQQKYKPVVQLGYWLRKLFAIHELNLGPSHTKMWLPSSYDYSLKLLDIYLRTVKNSFEKRYKWAGVSILRFIENKDFDDLISRSIVFIDLYDSSANNAIIECMARNTPIVVNKLPAVVEYLGEEYPLYFCSLEEASNKIKNINLIMEGHRYLKNMNKTFLSGKYFVKDLCNKLDSII